MQTMKRLVTMTLALLLLLTAAACAPQEVPSAQAETHPLEAAYMAAAQQLVAGEYEAAAAAFAALTGYGDAPQMAIYCRGLGFAAAGDYATAAAAFAALGDFKDSAILMAYYTGVGAQAEAEAAFARGRLADLEQAETAAIRAETAFAALPFLPDVPERLAACRVLRAETAALLPGLRLAHQCENVLAGDGEHFIVRQGGQYGVLHVSGRLVVPCEWDYISQVFDGLAVVYRGRMSSWGEPEESAFGVIDLQGNVILPCEYGQIYLYDSHFMALNENGAYDLYTPAGELWDWLKPLRSAVAPGLYTEISAAYEGWRLVDDAGTVLFSDETGSINVLPTAEGNLWLFSYTDDYRQTMMGLLSTDGQMLIPMEYISGYGSQYPMQQDFECMLLTSPDGTMSAWSAEGEKLFDNRWESLTYLGNGLFLVSNDEYLSGVVDSRGGEVLPCVYDHLGCMGGFIVAQKESEDHVTIFSREGNMLLTLPEEDSYGAATPEYLAYVLDGMLHIIDQQGNAVY